MPLFLMAYDLSFLKKKKKKKSFEKFPILVQAKEN